MTLTLVYPHPKGARSAAPASKPHETGGIPGNWAYDFMAPGGTLVLAPQAGAVTRWSGHDPDDGVFPGAVFGRSLYLKCADGVYFITHLAYRYAALGERVEAGDVIGRVGHWPPPRGEGASHTHCGFTAKAGGKAASVARIHAVKAAKRVPPVWPV